MKAFALAATALLLTACGSTMGGGADSGPALEVTIAQTGNTGPDVFHFSGPINIQYELAVSNATNTEYRLERIDLRSVDDLGAYQIRTGATPIAKTIAPNGTTMLNLSAWGHARGGYLTADAPVTLRGVLYFRGPEGTFTRHFVQNVSTR